MLGDASGGASRMTCCQVALSTSDIGRSHQWYRRALGFRGAGERRHREGEQWAAVPGLPEASFDVWCLVGRDPLHQIEMFQFYRPRPRALPSRHRPCDFGYTTLGVHVGNIDAALEKIVRAGGEWLTEPVGDFGQRRVCLRDPDGILIELMEDQLFEASQSELQVASVPRIQLVAAAVRDIDMIREFWVGILGLDEVEPATAHTSSHESLWGLDGAIRESMVLRSGHMALEFVRYPEARGRPRPAGYLISDLGILNVALGSTDRRCFAETYQRACSRGFTGHSEPWTVPGVATVVYLEDPQGLSVELLHVEPDALARMGFVADQPDATLGR